MVWNNAIVIVNTSKSIGNNNNTYQTLRLIFMPRPWVGKKQPRSGSQSRNLKLHILCTYIRKNQLRKASSNLPKLLSDFAVRYRLPCCKCL